MLYSAILRWSCWPLTSTDEIIERLAQSELSVNEAVCYTLIARHYKRIVVHLANVATSVIQPLSDLDYWDETRD